MGRIVTSTIDFTCDQLNCTENTQTNGELPDGWQEINEKGIDDARYLGPNHVVSFI